MSSSKPAIRPTPSASCRCSTATSPAPASRHGRPPPTAATPAGPISPPPRTGGCRRCLSQEVRHRDCRHGQEPLGLPRPAQLPRRHRSRRRLVQARLRRRPLHLARSPTLQGLPLVCRGRPQPGAVRPTQTGLAASWHQVGALGKSGRPNCSQHNCSVYFCHLNTKGRSHAPQSVQPRPCIYR